MNVKVQCSCGQAYAFDVEPVNGAMPCGVNCPACGVDGTQLANQAISESQFTPPPTSAPPPSGLRINRPAASTTAPQAPTSAPPAEPPPPQRYGYTRTLEPDKAPPPRKENVPMGILGGVIAGFVAMLAWYSITLATDRHIGIVAWGVGVLVGVGVRTLGRDGSPFLGFVAAVCACLAILGGDFLLVGHVMNKSLRGFASIAYTGEMAAAREAVSLKTDAEIRKWLEENKKEGSASVSPKDIDEFRAHGQAEMQDFVNGKPTQEQFEKEFVARMNAFSVKMGILKETLSLFTILWLGLGIASAYRIGSA
jgi:hypothetical protein